MSSAFAGLLTGLSLIVAIGAQNAYVLRQGLMRERVGLVVAICAASDLALIVAGVGGIGGALTRAPGALAVVRWLGVAFLLWFAASSLLRARRRSALRAADGDRAADASATATATAGAGAGAGDGDRDRDAPVHRRPPARRAVAARTAAFTWLNPHVYLDTVVLLGTVAGHEGATGRWWFAAGAGLASVLWFTGLGYGARLAAGVLASPRAWRTLDVLIAVTILLIALRLATG